MSRFILLLFFFYQGQILGGTHAALYEFGRVNVWEYYPPVYRGPHSGLLWVGLGKRGRSLLNPGSLWGGEIVIDVSYVRWFLSHFIGKVNANWEWHKSMSPWGRRWPDQRIGAIAEMLLLQSNFCLQFNGHENLHVNKTIFTLREIASCW